MSRGFARRSLCIGLLLSACSQDPTGTGTPDGGPGGGGTGAATITVSAPPGDLVVGSQMVLTTTVKGPDGSLLDGIESVTWSTSDSSVATVGGQSRGRGTVTAISVGRATITATAAGASASVLIAVDSGGNGGGGGGGGGVSQDSLVASLTIAALPGPLAVGTQWSMEFEARDSAGVALRNVSPAWSSSLPSVLPVTVHGTITAVDIGEATITARANGVTASILVTSTAEGLVLSPPGVSVPLGDSLKLTARLFPQTPYGPPGPVQSGVSWASSNPAAISVSPGGWATAHMSGAAASAVITASVGGVTGIIGLYGSGVSSGLSTSVRYVYGGGDLGPLTVNPTKGTSAVLAWGHEIEQAIGSGILQVNVEGLPARADGWPPPEYAGLVPPNRSLTLYLSGYSSATYLNSAATITPVWDEAPAAPPDTALVRLVMTSWYSKSYIGNNIYVLPAGAPIDDFPLFCYFDIGAISPYLRLGPGTWDIVIVDPESFVLVPGHPGHEYFRFRVTPQPGRATTYAIVGNDSTTMRLIATVEP